MTHDTASNLETVARLGTPVWYKGEGPTGAFLFAEGAPTVTHISNSLADAVEEFGRRIKIETSSISSARHHAGYNSALAGEKYEPQTRVSDGAPRVLNERERFEYAMGFIEGLLCVMDMT